MTSSELARSVASDSVPPPGLSDTARALWFAKAGRWDEAHDLCQDIPGAAGAWIHAHLHREEGDLDNASYWYRRAGKPVPPVGLALAVEWERLAAELLG